MLGAVRSTRCNGLKVESIPLNSVQFPGAAHWPARRQPFARNPAAAEAAPAPMLRRACRRKNSDAVDGRRVPRTGRARPPLRHHRLRPGRRRPAAARRSACTGPGRSHEPCAARRARATGPRAPGLAWLAVAGPTLTAAHPPAAAARATPVRRRTSRTLLPLAVVSSAAAAGVHAAMGPVPLLGGIPARPVLRGLLDGPARVGQPGAHLRRRPPPARRRAAQPRLRGPVGGHPHPRPAVRPDPRARGGGWLGRGHRRLGAGRRGLLPGRCCGVRRTSGPPRWDAWTRAPRVWLVVSVLVLAVLSFTAGGS